ncbi:MAG: transposase [Acetobacteraceae bacterium]|nr:transposase [Acetobacteraceae bacterium]
MPIVTGLCRSSGNGGKIALAKTLLRAVGDRLGPLCLLLDAWYMRASLIHAALRRGHAVVGQVRRDTALFSLPPPRAPGQRGRPRLYGERIDAAAVARLPVSTHRIGGYGGRLARLRHLRCRPRFLHGVVVRAVWCELAKPHGGWARQRLLLCTDPDLSAPAVVEAYAHRWTVGAPVRRAQADRRPGGHVAARPQHAPALAALGSDRSRAAGPADRAGRAGGARVAAGWWLAQGHDADPGLGQGRAGPSVG